MKYSMALLTIAGFLSGCSPVKLPNNNQYEITPLGMKAEPNYRKTQRTILVSQPIASSGYNTARMAYMLTPFKISYFADNAWVAPPANMVLPVFVSALRQSGYFKAVVSPPFAGVTDYRLDTQLLRLQQEFLLPISEEHLMVQATLINNNTNRVIATKLFNIVQPAPQNNPYSGVLAANKATSRLSLQLSQFVLRAVSYSS